MRRKYEEERKFNEKLDQLLAGGKINVNAVMEEDLRTALDFAGRMTEIRPTPSPQFQANLKARLLQKLSEQESQKEASRGWFWRLIPREPIWQAVAILAVVILAGGILWGTLFHTSPPQMVSVPKPTVIVTAPATKAPTTSTAPAAAAPGVSGPAATSAPAASAAPSTGNLILRVDASTGKSAYAASDTVSISISWQNVTAQTITIQEFPPIVSVMQASTKQPVFTFAAGKNTKTLAPGETANYVLTWNQIDAKDRHVTPGSYYLELEEMYYQGREVPMKLSRPVSFEILN